MNESLSRITHETPKQTSLRDALVASSQEWMRRLVPIVKEVTGNEDVDVFLKEKPRCPPDVIKKLTPIVEALNEIAVMMKEVARGKTAQDLRVTYGDAFREYQLGPETKERILEENKQWQREFFGHEYEMPPIPEAVTAERLKKWERLRFKLRYLPPERMTKDKNPPGWKKKPGKIYTPDKNRCIEFFDYIKYIQTFAENQSNPNLQGLSPLDLPGRWVLIDTRPKPDQHFNEATNQFDQEYENDADIQQIINGTRYDIHPIEFFKPEFWTGIKQLLQIDDISSAIIRLPRVIEQSVLGQGSEWDGTGTLEWSEELFDYGARLMCGNSRIGGVSCVDWGDVQAEYVGFRPMVVFS